MAKQVFSLFGRITVDERDATKALRGVRSQALSATNVLKNMRDQARTTGIGMSVGLTAPLVLLGKAAVNAAGDYDESMALFQNITKASASDMELAGSTALRLGSDLRIPGMSAAETSSALLALAQNGLRNAKDATAALLPTLLLAAAAQKSGAEGAEMMTNALKLYKLPATEAMTVTDMFVNASLEGAQSVSSINDAFRAAAPVWAAANVPMADLMTSIALLGTVGIKGADAGAALRNVMSSLMTPTDEARGALAAMGIQAYDVNQKLKPWGELMPQLTQSLAGMTEAQRNQRLEAIFGKDTLVATTALFGPAAAGYGTLRKAIEETGAAQAMANAQTNNLNGMWNEFMATAKTTLIAGILPFKDGILAILNVGTGFLAWLASANPTILKAGVAFLAVVAVVGPLIALFAGITPIGLAVAAVFLGLTLALASMAAGTVIANDSASLLGLQFKKVADAANAFLAPAISKLGTLVNQVVRGDFAGAFRTLQDIYTNNILPFTDVLGGESKKWADIAVGWIKQHVLPLLPPQLTAVVTMLKNWASDNKPLIQNIGEDIGGALMRGMYNGIRNSSIPMPTFKMGVTAGPGGAQIPSLGVGVVQTPLSNYLPALADGGIVTRPTVALIGEAGPEAVVPLSGGRGGAGGTNVTVQMFGNVYGMSDFEDQVISTIQQAKLRGRLV